MWRCTEPLEDRLLLSAVGNTLTTAEQLSPVAGTPNVFFGAIGDESGGAVDCDVFQINLTAGQQLTADIDAQAVDAGGTLGTLNSFLRLFNSNGTLLASNDDGRDPETGVTSDDSLLTFTAAVTGTYYLGISSAANANYDPVTGNTSSASTGAAAETGDYRLQVSVTDGLGWATSSAPAVSGLSLVNDTGTGGDGITSDLRIAVNLGYGSSSSSPYVWLQFDLNGDGVAESTSTYMNSSQAELDLGEANLSAGAVNVRVRGGVWSTPDIAYGNWTTLSFTYAPTLPVVSSLSLLNDTGTPGDQITSDPRISGVLTLPDTSSAYLPLQYDLNGDGVFDGSVQADMTGHFTVDLTSMNLTPGTQTVAIRGGRYLSGPGIPTFGAWSSFSFTYVAPPSPTVPSVTSTVVMNQQVGINLLANATPGQAGNGLSLYSVGQAQHGSIYQYGNTVYYTPSPEYTGTDSFSFTVSESNGAKATSSVTVTVTAPLPPQITDLRLQNNTGTAEAPVTTYPLIAGTVSTATVMPGGASSIQFDYNGDGTVDTTTYDNWDRTFSYNVGQGSPNAVNYGPVTIRVRAVDNSGMNPLYGEWQTLSFTYEAPPLPTVPGITSTVVMNQQVGINLLANVTPGQAGDSVSLYNVGQAQHGSIYQYGSTVYYTPYPGYTGSDSFSFTVSESNGAFVTSNVSITVTAPLPPQVSNLHLQNNLGTAEEPLTRNGIVAGTVSNLGPMPGSTAVQFDYNGDGTVDATTYANWEGTFAYNVGQGSPNGVGYGPVTLRVRAADTNSMLPLYGEWQTFSFTYEVPPLPTVPAITSTVVMNQQVGINLLAYVTPGQVGDSVSLYNVGQAQHGLIYQYGSTVYYTPAPGFTGADSFSFTVSESNGAYVTSTVSITVTAPLPPQVSNLHLQNNLGTAEAPRTTNGIVVGTVTGSSGMMPGMMSIQFDYNSDGAVDATGWANWDGTFSYNVGQGSPNGLNYGQVTIRVRAADTSGMLPLYGDWQSLSFTYEAPPLPTVPAITSTVAMNQQVGINLLANVTPGQAGDSVNLSSVGQPQHGSIYQYGSTVYYTPYPGYIGSDNFSFTVSESNGAYVTSSVSITVTAPLPPQIANLHLQSNIGTTEAPRTTNGIVAGTVTNLSMMPGSTAVQFDYNGDGTVDASAYANWEGTFAYNIGQGSPNGVNYGPVTLRVRATDTSGMFPLFGEWQTFSFTYEAPPLPTVPAVTSTVVMSQQVGINLLANVTPGQSGDSVSLYSVGQAQHGSIYQYGNTVYYTPAPGYTGTDNFSFTIAESNGAYVTSNVSITVTAPLPPQLSNLQLQTNLGTTESPLTKNGIVTGMVSNVSPMPGSAAVQFDYNGDGAVDATTYANWDGTFAYNVGQGSPNGVNYGEVILRARATDTSSMVPVYGEWQTLSFTYEAPALPTAQGFSLVNDTGTPGDSITADLRIRGSVTNDTGTPANLPVQFDINGDSTADGTVYTNSMGEFIVDLSNLNVNEGLVTLQARAGRQESAGMAVSYGAWSSFTFTYTAPVPQVTGLALVVDTGTPGDLITADVRVSGALTVSGMSAAYLPVQYDLNADGVIDGTTQTDMLGQFTIDLRNSNLVAGTYTISVRGGWYGNGQAVPQFGPTSDLSFTYSLPASPPNTTPVLQGMQFTYASQPAGMPVTGNLTGTLADTSVNSTFALQFDYDGDGISDAAFGVAVGQVSANLTVPSGVSATRVRVVETESDTGNTLTSGWSIVTQVSNDPPGEGGSGPGGPAPVVVDWDAIHQAHQDVIDAGIAFDQALADAQVAMQSIQATYIVAQQQAENEHAVAIAAAAAEYTIAMQAAETVYDNTIAEITAAREIKQEEIEDEQDAEKVAAAAENAAEVAAALNEYNQAKLEAQAAYDARQETADQVYAADLQAANDAYTQAGQQIDADLQAAKAASAAVHADELAAANLALNNAVAAAEAVRNSAMAANQAARDAAIADQQAQLAIDTAGFSSSWTYDVSAVQNDPAVLAAIDSANSSFQLAVGLADQAYETAIDSAEETYNSAITAAGDDWESAWTTAELARLNARAAAAAAYQTAVTTASNTYQAAVATAAQARADAKAAAEEAYNASEEGARETRNNAYDAAWETYTQAMNAAQATLDSGLAADQTLYSGLMVPIRTAWNTAVTNAGNTFNTSMADAAGEYQRDMAWNVANIYNAPANLAWSGLQAVLNGLYTVFSSAAYAAEYASYEAAITSAQVWFNLGLYTQEDVWQAKKNLALWAAQEAVDSTKERIPGELAYIEKERNAATALAIATAAAAFTLSSQQLSATELATNAKIDANSTYELGIAGVERDQLIARTTKTATYLISALNAALVLDQAKVAADKTYAIAVAGFQESYDKAINVAEQVYALAEQAAAVVQSKALVDADVVQVKAGAVADLAAVKASTAANTAYTQAAAAAAVSYVEAAGTAATVYSIAYTAAAKSAVTPVIMAQAAAICQQLGGGPDAFFFTQRFSMEKLADVDAWASQVKDDVAAEAAFNRTQALAYQASANAEAAADQKQTNADADAAKKAIDDDADAWKTASKQSIDADASRGTEDINAAKEANDQDAEADKSRTEKEATASAKRQRANLTADYTADILEVAADVLQTTLSANAAYDKLVAEAPATVQRMKADITADIQKARAKAARDAAAAKAAAAEDAKLAIANAKEIMAQNVDNMEAALAMTASQPLSNFQWGGVIGAGVQWAIGPGLDGAVNFSTGFMDGLTNGAWSAGVGQTGLLSYVDRGSLMYAGGQVTGVVYGIALSAATGMTCQVSWATRIGSGIAAVETGYGMYEAGPRILNGTATVWDYAAFLPAAGYVLGYLNRACFVAETEIATGWGSVTDASLTVSTPTAESGPQAILSQSWSIEWILLGTGIIMLTAVYRHKRDKQETAKLDRFFEELAADDLADDRHAALPPPDPSLASEQPDFSDNAMADRDQSMEVDDTAWSQQALLSGLALAAGSTGHRPNKPPVSEGMPLVPTAVPSQTASRRCGADHTWQMSPWMTTVALLLALGCFWLAAPTQNRTGVTPTLAATAADNTSDASGNIGLEPERTLTTRRIDQIRPGMRVLADNPELYGQNVPERVIDPKTTRLVTLHQVKPDGNELTVHTLISIDTLAAQALEIWGDGKRKPEHRPWIGNAADVILKEALLGQSLDLSLPEMGAEGPAEIIAIAPCPQIESANEPGRRLVTSVFRHTSNEVVDLEIQGRDTPIGTTSNHPFWSVDREGFVPAGDLRIGERLKRADELYTQVTHVSPRRGPPTSVYNLEVDGQHVYHVGLDGLLVHNTCTTVIGRMDDLKRFDLDPSVDTWWKSGRIPKAGEPPVSLRENRKWLQDRIDRGDQFGIATNPALLPPATGGYIPGVPNGSFTAFELDYLLRRGINVLEMW